MTLASDGFIGSEEIIYKRKPHAWFPVWILSDEVVDNALVAVTEWCLEIGLRDGPQSQKCGPTVTLSMTIGGNGHGAGFDMSLVSHKVKVS